MCMCQSKGTFSLFVFSLFSVRRGGGRGKGWMAEAEVEVAACGMGVHRLWKMEIVSKTCMGC